MSQWLTILGVSLHGTPVTHIVPVNDMHDHALHADCWCQPHLDHELMIATHNSADRREDFESGKRKPS